MDNYGIKFNLVSKISTIILGIWIGVKKATVRKWKLTYRRQESGREELTQSVPKWTQPSRQPTLTSTHTLLASRTPRKGQPSSLLPTSAALPAYLAGGTEHRPQLRWNVIPLTSLRLLEVSDYDEPNKKSFLRSKWKGRVWETQAKLKPNTWGFFHIPGLKCHECFAH